jgi:hypothetical protein
VTVASVAPVGATRAGTGGRVERTLARTSQPPGGAASKASSPSQLTSRTVIVAGGERLARADDDAARLCVQPHDIERVAAAEAETAALADRVVDDALMAAENGAGEVDDVAGLRGARAQLLDHRGIAARRHEADVLAVGLVRHGQAELDGERARRRLVGQVAEREAQEIELVARGREQEIALIARRSAARCSSGPFGPSTRRM